MNASNDIDRRVADYLADGPSRASERSIAAALGHARSHPRRRDPLAALRRDPMGSSRFGGGAGLRTLPLVAALGLLLVGALAIAAIGGVFDQRPVVVAAAAPSASAVAEPRAERLADVDPECRPQRIAGRHQGRSRRRHRRRRVRRDHRPVGHARRCAVRPGRRGQRGRRRRRCHEHPERSGIARSHLGRQPVRHATRADHRPGRQDDDDRPDGLPGRRDGDRSRPRPDVRCAAARERRQRVARRDRPLSRPVSSSVRAGPGSR